MTRFEFLFPFPLLGMAGVIVWQADRETETLECRSAAGRAADRRRSAAQTQQEAP